MPNNKKSKDTAKSTDVERQEKMQNDQHNTKKVALGPNTRR